MPGRRSRKSGRAQNKAESTERAILSPMEIECLSWAAEGKSAVDIATILDRSVHTVRHHLRRVHVKLGVHSRIQAVERARALSLLKPLASGASDAPSSD